MVEFSRRQFLKLGAGGLLGLHVGSRLGGFTQVAEAAIPGGTLDVEGLRQVRPRRCSSRR